MRHPCRDRASGAPVGLCGPAPGEVGAEWGGGWQDNAAALVVSGGLGMRNHAET